MPRGGGGDSAFFPTLTKSLPLYEHVGGDDVEISGFRACLRWMCLDQSDGCRAAASWSVFLLLAAAVPALSHFALAYSPERRPYDLVAQISLTAAAVLSFLTLSALTRRYGLRRFLFLNKLPAESDRVRHAYAAELRRSTRLLACLVAPCFAAEVAYKLSWYLTGAGRVPFVGNPVIGGAAACALELASWIYRTASFFLVCVLFRLICHLHILRLQDFAAVFEEESDVEAVLREHLRVRRQLKVISHRFRGFILFGMVMVTASQFAATLVTLRPQSDDNLFNTGELALCSIVLVTGLFICLRSAAKITHKAQALTSHATKWHVCATIESFAMDQQAGASDQAPAYDAAVNDHEGEAAADDSDDEGEGSEEDELEGTKVLRPHVHTVTFQKRQALVTYLENNRAGITIFGFTLDRAWLHTIFMLEVVLFLWLLGKTIGIS
ncbi:hypothetical protein Cni_G01300 [Canna indica]|uniref:Extracellular ligand-gated ion channel n=1 Tax=Canna indica TaxID=4628 RepID=A0AAQ3JP92_9LILI|nr:hypothetical protein Cni_G01300 [Canna indica]